MVLCYTEAKSRYVTKLYGYIFLGRTTFLIESDENTTINRTNFAKICKSWQLRR